MNSTKSHNLIKIKTKKLVDSLFVGNYIASFSGKGVEFDGFKEYEESSDSKDIDWATSTRENKIISKKYLEERELDIYFLLDLDESFLESFSGEKKLDVLLEFLYLIGYSAIKSGDKIGSYFYNTKKLFYPKKGNINLENIIKNLNINKNNSDNFLNKYLDKNLSGNNFFIKKNIDNSSNITDNFMLKKSLIFYLTGDISLNNKNIKKLSAYNDLVVVNIFNYFENNLNGSGIFGLKLGEEKIYIDLDNENLKKKYKILRNENIDKFKKEVYKSKARYLYLDTKSDVYKEVLKFMSYKKI